MAANFPNSPTNGQQFTVGSVTWQWDSTAALWTIVKPNVIPDAPADGKQYLRINNTWRLFREDIDVSGLSTFDFTPPSWARRMVISGNIFLSATNLQFIGARYVMPGSVVLQTAGDYSVSGFNTGGTGTAYANVDSSTTYMPISPSSSTIVVPQMIQAEFDLIRPNTSVNFSQRWSTRGYQASNPYTVDWFSWVVNGKTSSLTTQAIRLYSSLNPWGPGSIVSVEYR